MDPSHRSRFPLIRVSDAYFTREHVYSMLHTTSKTSTNEAPFILISDLLLDEIKKPPPPTLSPSRIDGTLKRRKNIMGFADEFISLSRALVLVYTDITPLISSATTLSVQQRHELEQLSIKLMKLITRYETKVAAIQETFFTWKQRSVFYGGLTSAVLVSVAILLLLPFFNASLVDFPTIQSILDATDTTVLIIVGLATAWSLNASLASLEATQRLLTYFSEYTFRDVMGWLAFHDSLEPFIKSGHSIQNHPFSRNLKEKWVVDSMERAFIYEEEMCIFRNAYGYHWGQKPRHVFNCM